MNKLYEQPQILTENDISASGASRSGIRLVLPENGAEVPLLTPRQLKFIRMSREQRRAFFLDAACRKELVQDGAIPRKVMLAWEDDDDANEFTVTLATTENFEPGTCVNYSAHEKSLEVDNLLIATKYYWRVSDGKNASEVSSFITSDVAPRLMRVPNVGNFRDLGGRIGLDGRRVKQNLVFRSGGINDSSEIVSHTEEDYLSTSEEARAIRASMERTLRVIGESTDEIRSSLASRNWTVFQPEKKECTDAELAQIMALKEIPDSIMGASGVKMAGADDDNMIGLPPSEESEFAVFMQYIDAPERCMLPFLCGADWRWRMALNGEVVFDLWRCGNIRTTDITNYHMLLPLKPGRNLMTVVIASGRMNLRWHYGPIEADMSREKIVSEGCKSLQAALDNQCVVVDREANGKIRHNLGRLFFTEEGRRYMLDELKIRSEIDLRTDEECIFMSGSSLGSAVKWFQIPYSSYAGINLRRGQKASQEVFRIFLDERNYPINFHCISGQDRTGTVACIINGLLGVSEEELYLDWEESCFCNSSTDFKHETHFDKLIEALAQFEGSTLNERIENYVISLGFTHDDIQHLREILLGNTRGDGIPAHRTGP